MVVAHVDQDSFTARNPYNGDALEYVMARDAMSPGMLEHLAVGDWVEGTNGPTSTKNRSFQANSVKYKTGGHYMVFHTGVVVVAGDVLTVTADTYRGQVKASRKVNGRFNQTFLVASPVIFRLSPQVNRNSIKVIWIQLCTAENADFYAPFAASSLSTLSRVNVPVASTRACWQGHDCIISR